MIEVDAPNGMMISHPVFFSITCSVWLYALMSSYSIETLNNIANEKIQQYSNQSDPWLILSENISLPNKICFGITFFEYKIISLDTQFFEKGPDDEVMDTLLHECAHAIVGVDHNKNGRIIAHGSKWKRMARQLGCKNVTAKKNIDVSWLDTSKYQYEIVKRDGDKLSCYGFSNKRLTQMDVRGTVEDGTFGNLYLMEHSKWIDYKTTGSFQTADLLR